MSFKLMGDSRYCEGGTYRVMATNGGSGTRTVASRRDRARAAAVETSHREADQADKIEVVQSTAAFQPTVETAQRPRPRAPAPKQEPSLWEWFQGLFKFNDMWDSYARPLAIPKPRRYKRPQMRPKRQQRMPAYRAPARDMADMGLAKTQQTELAKPHTKPTAIGLPKTRARIAPTKPLNIPASLTGLTKLFKN